MLGVDAVFIEEPVIKRGVQMDKTARDGASADAHFGDRLSGLGKVGVGVAGIAASADDRKRESDDKRYESAIPDQFQIELQTNPSVLSLYMRVSMKGVNNDSRSVKPFAGVGLSLQHGSAHTGALAHARPANLAPRQRNPIVGEQNSWIHS